MGNLTKDAMQQVPIKCDKTEVLYGPNGTFTNALRTAVQATGRYHIYVVGEGPEMKAVWIESLNTVLDDNKVFCLENGERIRFGDNVRFIFFWEHAKDASPAT